MQLDYDGRVFRFPWRGECRLHTDRERESLKQSIREHGGFTSPIVLDDDDNVIDGHTRLEIAMELGIPLSGVPFIVKSGLDDEEKRSLSISLNLDRRHLTLGDQEDMAARRRQRIIQASESGRSIRKIASDEGVSPSQVRRDLGRTRTKRKTTQINSDTVSSAKEAEASPEIDHEEGGAPYGAHRNDTDNLAEDTVSEEADCALFVNGANVDRHGSDCTDVENSAPEVGRPTVVDSLGFVVPSHLEEVFIKGDADFAEIDRLFSSLARKLDCVAADGHGAALRKSMATRTRGKIEDGQVRYVFDKMRQYASISRASAPYCSRCPRCLFETSTVMMCGVCDGNGWVTKDAWDQCPADQKANVYDRDGRDVPTEINEAILRGA